MDEVGIKGSRLLGFQVSGIAWVVKVWGLGFQALGIPGLEPIKSVRSNGKSPADRTSLKIPVFGTSPANRTSSMLAGITRAAGAVAGVY
jgi:hypothetical protein